MSESMLCYKMLSKLFTEIMPFIKALHSLLEQRSTFYVLT